MASLLSPAQQTSARNAIRSVFDTFARPLTLYLEAQTVTISTDPNWSRFGQSDQQLLDPAVVPQVYTVTGCVMYGEKQPFGYTTPYGGGAVGDGTQLKIRDADGTVRIKFDASGYALMQGAKRVVLDGFTFDIDTTPRPHGVIGAPDRWTYVLDKVE